MKDTITLKGERNLWIDFISCLKKQKKEVWQVLEKFIKDYLRENEKYI